MINLWEEEFSLGVVACRFNVFVINDLYQDWKGTVRLRIMRGTKTIAEQSRDCTVGPFGREILTFEQRIPQEEGSYQLIGELVTVEGTMVRSLRDFKMVSAG